MPSATESLRVLITDDNALNRKLLRVVLEAENHHVFEADNGISALQLLDRERIDAIISDILMPEMDGYRLCYEIRKSPKLKSLPFIVYTASYTSPMDEKVALQFGVDKFLRKPASSEEIVKSLHEVLASAKLRARDDVQIPEEAQAMREYNQVLVRKLEDTIVDLSEANKSLAERSALAEFVARVSTTLAETNDLRKMLQGCCDAMVHHLDAAFARIWTLNEKENVLELQASSGMYTHIDGGHARIPVGQFKIGLIAKERKPHLTNALIGDPRIHDQEWAKREGIVAFAGYPLLIADQLVGVMAVFSRTPLSQNALGVMNSVAHNIAVGVQRQLAQVDLRASEERFRELAENINEIFFVAEPDGGPIHYVSPGHEQITGQKVDELYKNPHAWVEMIHPDDRARVEQAYRDRGENLDQEYRIVRPEGGIRWLRSRAFPINDSSGKVVRVVGIATDITERKQAEAKVFKNLERIRALHEIDLAITSTLDLQTVLKVLLLKMEVFFPYPTVTTVRLLNRTTGALEALACHNMDIDDWKKSFVERRGGRAFQILRNKEPLIVQNVLGDSGTVNPGLFQKYGLVSYIGLPLIAKDTALGVLNFYTKEEHEFPKEEIEFLKTLAGQAAIAIHNAQLFEETVRRRGEAEALARVARSLTETLDIKAVGSRIVSSIRELFGAKGATLRLLQPDGLLRRLVSAGEVFSQTSAGDATAPNLGLTHRAIAEGKAIWSTDTLNDPAIVLTDEMRQYQIRSGNRSMIVVPLRAHEKLIGTLSLSDQTGRSYSDNQVALLQTFADQVALALDNARLYEQTERQLKRTQGVSDINNAIASTLSLKNVLDVLLEKIELFSAIDLACGVRLFDEASGNMVPLASRRIPFEEWKLEVANAKGRLTKRLIETRKPVAILNMYSDSRTSLNNFARRHGLISYLGVPLIVRDQFIGNLVIYTKAEHAFSAEEIEFFTSLGSQAAIAIHNARLHEQTERQLKRIEALREIEKSITSTLDLSTVLNVLMNKIDIFFSYPVAATVRLFDKRAGLLEPAAARNIEIGEWITAMHGVQNNEKSYGRIVVEQQEPLIIANVQTDPRTQNPSFYRDHGLISYAGVPLVAKDEMLGVLGIYTKEEHAFSEEEIELLMVLAGQAAIAIHNAKLYEEEQAREAQLHDTNRMLSALHAVGAATSQTLNIDQILKSAIEKIIEIFGFDATHIHIYDPQRDELVLRAYFESDPAGFTAARSFKKGQGIVGRVVETGDALIFDDVQTDPRYRQMSRSKTSGQHGYHFFAVLPIKGRRETFGTLACVGNAVRKLSETENQLLEAITGQIAIALENSTLYQNVREKVDELQQVNAALQDTIRMLSALHAIAAAANQSLDLNRILQAAIDKITEIFDFDATRIHLLDPDSSQLVRRVSYEKQPERFNSVTTFKLGQGVIGKVAENGQALVFEDIETDPRYHQLTQSKRTHEFKDRFFAVFPIRSKSGTLGTLACLGHDVRKLSAAEAQLLEAITDQVAVAIENARLFEKNELSKRDLETTNRFLDKSLNRLAGLYTAMTPLGQSESLHEMMDGIIARLIDATGADAGLIRIWDKSGGGTPVIGQRGYSTEFVEELRPVKSEGAIHWVIEYGEPIIAPDIATEDRLRGKRQLNAGFQSCAILPLRVHNDVRGVIQISSRTAGYFDEEQKDHLLAVARQMSIALENRELFNSLKASRDELERANGVKDEFLSVMSHELRTPLSVVLGYSRMFQEQQLGPLTKEQQQAVGVVLRNSQELLEMIESIMDATKIEAGSMTAEMDGVSPSELLQEIKVAYEFPLAKNVRLEWQFPHSLPLLWSDTRKLRQILTNLINNAIKFTEEGRIVIAAEEKRNDDDKSAGHRLEFRVSDSGVGIPPEECEKIFERFHQVDSSQTRRFEGVGLGLYIVKSFTEMLGGRVSVRSRLGEGSTFTISLPVKTAA